MGDDPEDGGLTMRTILVLALLGAPGLGLAAAPAAPDWQGLPDCAAAYSPNAKIADPDRAPAMKASISELADDYAAAAVRRNRRQARTSEASAVEAVRARVAKGEADFSGRARADVERFIEACPQPDR